MWLVWAILACDLPQECSRCQLRLHCSEGLTGAGWSTLKAAHSNGWQISPGCWCEAPVSLHTDFSKGLLEYPHGMTAGFPQNDWCKTLRQKFWFLLCLNLCSYTPSLPQYSIGYIGQSDSVWKQLTREHKPQEERTTGNHLEAGWNHHQVLSILHEKYLSTLPQLWPKDYHLSLI